MSDSSKRSVASRSTSARDGVSPLFLAVGGSAAIAFAAYALFAVGVARGAVGLILVAVLWGAIPSAKRLSRRLVLNGAIGLGAIPVFWWLPWPEVGNVGHAGVIVAALYGYLAFHLFYSNRTRVGILPHLKPSDSIILVAAAFCLWFFLPFVKFRTTTQSIAMLMTGFGNDNVGHFDMFEMIRRTLVTGPGWGVSPGGSTFAYVPYPQHFHVLVAFIAEVWQGSGVASVDTETGLFGLGTAVVLSIAFVTLIAGIVAAKPLRKRPGIALVVSAGAASVLLLGLGSDSLRLGFPGFLLAVVGTTIACVLALRSKPTSPLSLLSLSSALILVAHTWFLLTPVAALVWLFHTARLPWSKLRLRRRRVVPVALICLGASVGVGYAIALVYFATRTVGSPEAVLAIGNPFAPISLTLPVAIACATLAVALSWLARQPSGLRAVTGSRRSVIVAALLSAMVAIIGIAESAVVVAIEIRYAQSLSYYQYKLVYGVTMVSGVMLIVLVGMRVAVMNRPVDTPRTRALAAGGAFVLACGLIAYSGFTAVPSAALAGAKAPGVLFRDTLAASSQTANSSTARLMKASTLMRSWPCHRPIYVATAAGDLPTEEANQWAMSFSSTWTEQAAPINRYMFDLHTNPQKDKISVIVEGLLTEEKGRCVIVAPQVKSQIVSATLSRFADQIFTWS